MSQKARGEVDFWGDQEEVRRKVREIVTKENEELQVPPQCCFFVCSLQLV